MNETNSFKNRFNLFRIKLSGGVLAYVVAISIVISILMLGMLLMKYYFTLSLFQSRDKVRVVDNVLSGFNLVRSNPSNQKIELDLYNKSADSIFISKRQWGFFVVATVGASDKSLVRSAFIGDANADRPSLYIANSPFELRLFGSSSIIGQSYVPNGKVKLGKIGDKAFSGKSPENTLSSSSVTFPKLSNDIDLFLKKYKSKKYSDFRPRDVEVSFQDSTKHFHSEDKIIISNKIKGNVIISSAIEITVRLHSDIENSILIAPKVIIEDNVQGQFQAIATDTLLTGERIRLTFPSILGVLSNNNALLEVNSGYVQGGVVLSTKGRIGRLNLKEDIEIDGIVYSNSAVTTSGVIRGSIYAKKTLLDYMGELSDNGINNTTISQSRDFGSSCYAIILDDTKKGEVLLWLD